jgi:hypothetical protein
MDKASQRWVERKLKGWAILNQWSFQISNVQPYLYVDPETAANKYLPKIFPMALTHDRHAHRRLVVVPDGAA